MSGKNKSSLHGGEDKGRKRSLLENGDERIGNDSNANNNPPPTAAAPGVVAVDEERQPLTNHHDKDTAVIVVPDGKDAKTALVDSGVDLPGDPHKEKLLANEGGESPTVGSGSGNKKKAGTLGGTMDTLARRRQELEQHLRTRTGLSRQGLLWAMAIVMLLLLLAVLVLALAAAWPRIPHPLQYPSCTTSPCLISSAQMLPRMNRSASRCLDFWNFSCGGWLADTPLPAPVGRWDLHEELKAAGREKARRVISKLDYPTNFNSLPWKLKYFYESCMALDNIEADKERPLLKIISELGGWHVLREFTVLSWDYRRVLTLLLSKYGVEPFFSISVVTDERRPQQSIIKVVPSGLGLPDHSYYYRAVNNPVVLAYKRYLKDVAQLLGAVNTDASSFSDEMFYFERRVAEITPEINSLNTDPIASYNRMTLADLKVSAPSIPLHDILLAKFPHANIDDKMQLLVPSKLYLSKISSIISTTDRGALNNYLMWRLASAYMPFLSQQFRDILSLHQRETAGIKEAFDRWEMCISTLQHFMRFAVTALTERTNNKSDTIKIIVSEMFEEIRATVQKNIEKSWPQNELYTHVISKLSGMSLQVGLPEPLTRDRYLEDLYSNLHVQKSDFFMNIRYGINYLQEEQERRLNNPAEEHRWIDFVTGQTVEYVPTANKVVVPPSVISEPFFDPAYPMPVLYGRLGIQLARAIVSAALPWNNLYAANGSLLSSWHPAINQSSLAIVQATACLSHFISSNNLTGLPKTVNRTVLNTLQWVSAVKEAYETFIRVELSSRHTHQPAMENFEPNELFFLNFAQSLCSKESPEQADVDEVTGSSISSSSLLKVIVSQLDEFSHTWNCHGDSSPLKGHQQCSMIL